MDALFALLHVLAPVIEIGIPALICAVGLQLYERCAKWPGVPRVATRIVAVILAAGGGTTAFALAILWGVSRWPEFARY